MAERCRKLVPDGTLTSMSTFMASISFDYGPFEAYVSSHGHYGIGALDVPWAVIGPLPGLLEHGRVETLNETWDDEGREPHRLIGKGHVRLFSRNGLSFTQRYHAVATAL